MIGETNLLSQWDAIEPDGHEVDSYVRLRVPEVSACRLYAARRVPDGLEAIILEVDKSAIRPGSSFPETHGFSLQAYPLKPGRTGDVRLILELAHTRYRDVFRSLGVDLVRALGSAKSQPQVVDALISRLARWQTFLKEHATSGLSAEGVRGLFGELAVLRDWLIPRYGADQAIGGWRGPFRATHDFQFPGGGLEVKTTLAVSPARFRVNNVLQLDDTNLARLLLCLVVLQESESEGESLVDVVESLRGSLGGLERIAFDEALVAAGFIDAHQQQYTSPRFVCRECRFHEVRDGFPRLRDADLPEGVTNLKYDVETGACNPFLMDDDYPLDVLFVGGGRKSDSSGG